MALPGIKIRIEADTDAAVAGIDRLENKIIGIPKATKQAEVQTKKLGGALNRLSNVSGRTRSQLQNVSFQLQDIIVQIQGGQGVTRALSQQLPQLAGGFGVVGAAIGVVAGLAIPALAFAFSGLIDDVQSVDDALSDLDEITDEYFSLLATSAGIGTDVFRDLEKSIQGASQASKDLLAIAKIETLKSIEALNSSISADILSRWTETEKGTVGALINIEGQLQGHIGQWKTNSREIEKFRSKLEQLGKGGPLEDQLALAIELRDEFKANVDVTGDMTDEQIAFWRAISQSIERMQILEAASGAVADEVDRVPAAIIKARNEIENSGSTYDEFEQRFVRTAAAAEKIPAALARARKEALAAASTYDEVLPQNRPDKPDSVGGVGGVDPDVARLETLIDSLKTEQETIEEFRLQGLELLANASEAELEALGGFNEAKLRLEEEYQNRLKGIKGQGHQTDLAMTLGAASDVLGAMGAFSDKALKLSKVAGAAQALISTLQGSAEALKLPFPANLAAAATVMAQGLGLVAAIKGVSSSGSSGGGGGGAAAAVTAQAAAPAPLNVRLSGLGAGDSITGNQLSSLFDRLQDEAGDRGLQVSFAS